MNQSLMQSRAARSLHEETCLSEKGTLSAPATRPVSIPRPDMDAILQVLHPYRQSLSAFGIVAVLCAVGTGGAGCISSPLGKS